MIPINEYMKCSTRQYMYWPHLIAHITFLFCVIPFSRGVSETGRKNAFISPFFYQSICYFASGLALYLIANKEGAQQPEDCDTQLLYTIIFGGIVIGVQILRAQLSVAAHSIATVDFEISQVAVIGAIAAGQSLLSFVSVMFQDWIMRDNQYNLYGPYAFYILGGFMMAFYLMNLMILPTSFNDGQLEHLRHTPIIFRQNSEKLRRKEMGLDLKLVFSNKHTTFKALAASLSAFLFMTSFGFVFPLLTEKYRIPFYAISSIMSINNIIFASVSLFTWVFTDCMMKKLVIFIAMLFVTPAILLVSRAELFSDDLATQQFVVTIGLGTIAAFLPLLQVPLIPELVSNFKAVRGSHADTKVNDFSAGVFFAFYTGGALTMNFMFGLGEYYTELPYDILLAVTVVFWICYASYVDVKSTCRKDLEEEVRISQRQPQARAYPVVHGADTMPFYGTGIERVPTAIN